MFQKKKAHDHNLKNHTLSTVWNVEERLVSKVFADSSHAMHRVSREIITSEAFRELRGRLFLTPQA